MKICVAQTYPVKGDVQKNIEDHLKFIDRSIKYNADLIIFPELSLTGYEPSLAKELATTAEDKRFNVFQELSNQHRIVIGVGIPLKGKNGIHISLILFQPFEPRSVYSKKYLHSDEEPYFVPGQNFPVINIQNKKIGLAICYEISINDHLRDAIQSGAEVYLASVAKSATGVEQASTRLSEIASQNQIYTFMANSIGPSDYFISAGNSSVWNQNGELIGQLDEKEKGILILDTDLNLLTKT